MVVRNTMNSVLFRISTRDPSINVVCSFVIDPCACDWQRFPVNSTVRKWAAYTPTRHHMPMHHLP